MESWVEEALACPRDRHPLRREGDRLACSAGHGYPIADGVPILLLDEAPPTLDVCTDTLERVAEGSWHGAFEAGDAAPGEIDPYVQRMVAGTCGNMYLSLVGRLPRYPIPELRLPAGRGRRLLDVGCGWGRWSASAARKGYAVVGIDPSLEAVAAARRVACQLGVAATYLVADARYLPFAADTFDTVYSYSVLQHFPREDAASCVAEVARVLKPSGVSLVEMPNAFGARNLLVGLRRRREPQGFDVRYWSPRELKRLFGELIGPSSLEVDSYFFINGQSSDRDLLPRRYRAVVSVSEALRKASRRARWLRLLADSLYVRSVARPG